MIAFSSLSLTLFLGIAFILSLPSRTTFVSSASVFFFLSSVVRSKRAESIFIKSATDLEPLPLIAWQVLHFNSYAFLPSVAAFTGEAKNDMKIKNVNTTAVTAKRLFFISVRPPLGVKVRFGSVKNNWPGRFKPYSCLKTCQSAPKWCKLIRLSH